MALNESYGSTEKEIGNLQQAIKQKDQSIISLIEKCEELSKSSESKSPRGAEEAFGKEKVDKLENIVSEKRQPDRKFSTDYGGKDRTITS